VGENPTGGASIFDRVMVAKVDAAPRRQRPEAIPFLGEPRPHESRYARSINPDARQWRDTVLGTCSFDGDSIEGHVARDHPTREQGRHGAHYSSEIRGVLNGSRVDSMKGDIHRREWLPRIY
jgi:hypothetical protein